MDEKSKKELIANNKEISRLLAENENILRRSGFQPPVQNYFVGKDDSIIIPSGYIRTSGAFWQSYHLNDIVKARNTKNNISYALQLSDFYNFLLNRFNIWGSIEIMLFKQATVNIVSIIEALVLECANNINENCQKCPKIANCNNNLNKYDRENMKHALEKLYQLGIIVLTNDEYMSLIYLYNLRNKIHIRLNQQNEFLDKKYNMELYNNSINLLQKVDEQILKNGVALYNSCMKEVETKI